MLTSTVHLLLNGEKREIPAGTSILELLARLELPPDRVAVECNRSIVRKEHWPATLVEDGWVLEIVTFVGGG